ncbi:cell division protein ZapD [Ottowia sp. SB7-C50]|uniref:cell division protein ZapD n=1 Tax=Ottowia sp. SB7-C50 TaxID=3081231 RepID=UPI002954925D|nr:cell division protein ZapD [Ottowia sp. SB7-C50]WOP16158.1 cell division protein ZapD [Ottowia sp. SB7-C50]
MILYEYPFNERVRTYLRLEHLFDRLGQLMAGDGAVDHHFALITMFEVMDVSGRADLKSDVLKDLERQRTHMAAFRGNPAISEASLDSFLGRVDDAFQHLSQQLGKPGHEMTDNEWLMGIRSRAVIPAGTCSFDLPAYHAWQHRPPADRRADLQGWAGSLAPMANAVALLLQILRDSGRPQKVMASAGQFQQTLPQNRAFQLLRLRIDESMQLVPEISGNRLVASVRLMRQDTDGKLQLAREDAPFELALCA